MARRAKEVEEAEVKPVIKDKEAWPPAEALPAKQVMQPLAADAFVGAYNDAKEITTINAYNALRQEMAGKGDFPKWNDLGERAQGAYLAAVTDCLADGHKPRTRFEQIVLKRMAESK